jgi:hypothetical protein
MHHDGTRTAHVRHGRETSACGRRTTQHTVHTMHHDGFGQLCSVLICMPRQMSSPYNLVTNSIARSKRNRAPILGPFQRCMLSPNNHDDIIINAPHRQHTAYRIQRGVPAARNTQRLHCTVRNTMHNVSQRATPSPMQRATRADAVCNMRHAPMQRATRTGAARTEETCHMQCAPMQHTTRAGATRIDATR